jgi:8-oxo-dGTP pyrophosphatase MutT (NUDIX family)
MARYPSGEIARRPGGERPRRSAILVTRDDRGRVLLVPQRGGPFKDAWLLPGGGLEDGESFEEALRREVREETGLDVIGPREVARYDVRAPSFHGEVVLYAGSSVGTLARGDDGWPTWADVDRATAHPVLLRELSDAGVIQVPDEEIASRLAALGIRMTRIR